MEELVTVHKTLAIKTSATNSVAPARMILIKNLVALGLLYRPWRISILKFRLRVKMALYKARNGSVQSKKRLYIKQKTNYWSLITNFIFFRKTIFLVKEYRIDTYARKTVLHRIVTAKRFSAKIALRGVLCGYSYFF